MRLFKKLALTLAASVGALLTGLVLAAILLVAEPQWFLTTRTVARAVRVFGGAYHPRWKTFAFDILSLSFSEKRFGLRAQDLCFENAVAGVEGCVKDLDVGLNVRLFFWGAKLTKISRFRVAGDHFNLDQTKSRPAAPAAPIAGLPTRLPDLLPEALRGFTLESLAVDLPANKITRAGGAIRAELHLDLDPARTRPMGLKLELTQSSGNVTRHYHAAATLDSDLLKGRALTYLDAQGGLKAEGISARFQARVEEKGVDVLAFRLSAAAKLPGRRVEADLNGTKDGQDFGLKGSAGVWEATGPVKSVQLRTCVLEARLKKDSTEWETLKFDGNFELEPEAFGLKRASRNFAKALEGRLLLSARSTPGLLAADHFDAEVSLTVKPFRDWYEFDGSFDAKVSGRASQARGLKISHKLDLGLKVPKFEDLVEYLAHTRYSVPAPIHVLQGPLSVSLKSSGDSRKEVQEFEYTVVSGLAAGRQALRFEAGGKLTAARLWEPERSFRDELDVIAQDIALQLPKFDLKGMAPFVPDSRIKTGPELKQAKLVREEQRKNPAKSSQAAYDLEMRVRTIKPALLYSNLARDPIPVALKLNLKIPSGGMSGTVEVQGFRANIFRRVASIDHVRLTGRAGSPLMDLDGLVVYKAGEAKIFIRMLGTAQKPQITFESDPPRNQADIMAMLLFGKSPSELDSDQQSSAANTQTAVANGAFGLASLYLLASTPVEYVGYDPVSRTYMVKLRLPGGATLQVGSDGQSKGVQLRKRLASNLAIQTELTNTQSQGNVVTTLLEWYGRH